MDLEGVDGYAVRRPLGAGSVGSAWLARDLTSGRPVVLKRVPGTEVPVPELFRRDLALAQGVRHPHIAPLLTIRQTEEDWLLVSEYVAAGTLADLLHRRGPLSRGELVTLVAPLAQALAAAHDAGLTHGHLGCGDVMFTADGRPMLTDFGLRLTAGRENSPAADDLIALRDLALRAGGAPKVFSLKLFSGDSTTLADRVLALAEPEPIKLGFGDDPAGGCWDGRPADEAAHAAPAPSGRDRRASRRGRRRTGATPTEPAAPGWRLRVPRGFVLGRPFGARGRAGARRARASRSAAAPRATPGGCEPAAAQDRGSTPQSRTSVAPHEPGPPEAKSAHPSAVDPARVRRPTEHGGFPDTSTPSAEADQVARPTGVAKLTASPSSTTPVAVAPARNRVGERPPRVWPELVSRVRLAHGLLVVAGLAAIVVAGTGIAMLRSPDDPDPAAYDAATPGAPTARPTLSAPATPGGPTGGPGRRSGTASAARWLRTLRALDDRRSRAFASGDLRGLDDVYVPGSEPWTSDRALLASYAERGLRVTGLRIRIDRLVVDRSEPGRVVLRVVDRLVAGSAVDRSGRRTALPPGGPAERLITLVGSDFAWQIAGVVAV